MELFNFYSLDECLNLKLIKKKLSELEDEGKIEFSIDGDVLKIKDLDLDQAEIDDLIDLFDSNDIFPYPDYQTGTDDEDFGFGDYDDYDEDNTDNY